MALYTADTALHPAGREVGGDTSSDQSDGAEQQRGVEGLFVEVGH